MKPVDAYMRVSEKIDEIQNNPNIDLSIEPALDEALDELRVTP